MSQHPASMLPKKQPTASQPANSQLPNTQLRLMETQQSRAIQQGLRTYFSSLPRLTHKGGERGEGQAVVRLSDGG